MSLTAHPLVARRRLLGAAVEDAKGTAETVAAPLQNTIVYDLLCPKGAYFEGGEREPNQSSSGSRPRERGPRISTWTFRTPLIHGSTDFMSILLQGCGFVTGGTPLVAAPSALISAQKTLTLVAWTSGKRRIMSGAAGTFVMRAEGPRAQIMVEWQFTGREGAEIDAAMPTDPAVSTASVKLEGATLTLAGDAVPQINSFELNANSQVEMREDHSKTDGVGYHIAYPATPTLSIDPEARLVADYDQLGLFDAGTAQALVLTLPNPGGAGNLTINGAAAQRVSLEDAARGVKMTTPIDLELHVTAAGDDQLTLTMNTA